MGQHKFRFSDMMPNSWFYKLRDMRRRSGASVLHRSSSSLGAKRSAQPVGTPRPVPVPMPHRSSYYYTSMDRELKPLPAPQPSAATEVHQQQPVPQTQSPAKSSRRRHRVGPVAKETAPEAEAPVARHRRRDMCVGRDERVRRPAVKAPSSTDFLGGKVITSETDIIFDLSPHPDDMPERVLRPIATRPARREAGRCERKERHVVVHHSATPRDSSASEQGNSRRSSVSSARRLKTRANSPRLAASRCSRKANKPPPPTTTPAEAASARKTTRRAAPPPSPLAESFAVVKASMDPRRDFRESMEEMIADKGIRGAADLEDLLACYLALNAGEHHGLIVEVFEDIWRSLAGVNP